jgi:hypothetical protein
MIVSAPYRQFLEAKVKAAPSFGLACSLDEVATHRLDGKPLRDHQRHIIRWGVEGGRRAFFLDFGLGKSTIQVETGRIILEKCAARDGVQPRGKPHDPSHIPIFSMRPEGQRPNRSTVMNRPIVIRTLKEPGDHVDVNPALVAWRKSREPGTCPTSLRSPEPVVSAHSGNGQG